MRVTPGQEFVAEVENSGCTYEEGVGVRVFAEDSAGHVSTGWPADGHPAGLFRDSDEWFRLMSDASVDLSSLVFDHIYVSTYDDDFMEFRFVVTVR